MHLKRYIALLLISLLLGCATDPHRSFDVEAAKPGPDAKRIAPILPKEVIARRTFTKLSTASADIYMVPSSHVPMVNFGAYYSLTVAIFNDIPQARTLKVKSQVVRASDGNLLLFYPIVSTLDNMGAVTGTIKPKYEFAFSKDTLTNEFPLPEAGQYFLIHTSPEFAQYSFLDPVSVTPKPNVLASIGKAITAWGGWLGPILEAQQEPYKVEQFDIGGGGIIHLQYE